MRPLPRWPLLRPPERLLPLWLQARLMALRRGGVALPLPIPPRLLRRIPRLWWPKPLLKMLRPQRLRMREEGLCRTWT